MALDTSKCNHLTPLPFKGLNQIVVVALLSIVAVPVYSYSHWNIFNIYVNELQQA